MAIEFLHEPPESPNHLVIVFEDSICNPVMAGMNDAWELIEVTAGHCDPLDAWKMVEQAASIGLEAADAQQYLRALQRLLFAREYTS